MINFRFPDPDINELCGRSNQYQFIFYCQPDEIEKKTMFFNFLSSLQLACCVSPHHCLDVDHVDEDTGEVEFKKGHFHFIIYYGAGKNKSVRQVLSLLDPILPYCAYAPFDKGDLPLSEVAYIWEKNNKVQNMRGALRYFKHLDHPHKFQYSDFDYFTFNGFELDSFLYNDQDCRIILGHIYDWINDNNCYLYCDLVDYCQHNNREWFSIVTRNNYLNPIDKYLKSLVFKNAGGMDRAIEKYSKLPDSEDVTKD